MAEKRGPVSRLATLVSLGVLAVVGFVFGLVAGGVWEDPGLVFDYLTGRTEELAFAPEPEVAPEPLPAVAASAATGAPEPKAAERPPIPPALPRRTEPEAAPKALAKAPAGPQAAVQVGAFAESSAAEKLASSLREKGYDTYISPSAGEEGSRWRVRVGPVPTREEAERVAARLKRDEKLPTWVLSED